MAVILYDTDEIPPLLHSIQLNLQKVAVILYDTDEIPPLLHGIQLKLQKVAVMPYETDYEIHTLLHCIN